MAVDVTRAFEAASRHVEPAWGQERLADGQRALVRRVRRRQLVRRTAGAMGMIALLVGGAIAWRAKVGGVAGDGIALLEDGSRARIYEGARLEHAATNSATEQRHRLLGGRARFDVSHRKDRQVFVVDVGDVTVQVLGTAFTLEREERRARVTVHEGRVRVSWPGGETLLLAGQSGVFPPEATAPSHPTIEPLRSAPPSRAASTPPRVTEAAPAGWRRLARAGRYDRAYVELSREGPKAVRDEPGDLLTAADVARLSGHPGEAVARLERLLSHHRSDPRAPLAAFTLGRLQLQTLRDPAAAGRSFLLARQLAPRSPLLEDILAREVEAWSLAGDRPRAQAAAQLYLSRFPRGDESARLRELAGLR